MDNIKVIDRMVQAVLIGSEAAAHGVEWDGNIVSIKGNQGTEIKLEVKDGYTPPTAAAPPLPD